MLIVGLAGAMFAALYLTRGGTDAERPAEGGVAPAALPRTADREPAQSRAADAPATRTDADGLETIETAPVASAALTIGSVRVLGPGTAAGPASAGGADYDFPAIEMVSGSEVMEIPAAPVPTVGSRRLLRTGTGPLTRRGQLADLRWDLFSWSTGARVGGSEDYSGATRTVRLGAVPDIPAAIDRAAIGRPAGSRVQVILPRATAGLPASANRHDAHVAIVDVLPATATEPDPPRIDVPPGLLGDGPLR